jgi:hypothetical protein
MDTLLRVRHGAVTGTGDDPETDPCSAPSMRVRSTVVAWLALAIVGCTPSDDETTEAPTTETTATTVPAEAATPASVTVVGEPVEAVPSEPTDPAETTTTTDPGAATVTVVGVSVAGNGGGTSEGSTQTFSETVREDDGSCRGWSGPGGVWTSGVVEGAVVQVFDASGATLLGTGSLGAGRADEIGENQWQCEFSWEVTVTPADAYTVSIAGLSAQPAAVVDGRLVVSIPTSTTLDAVSACEDATGPRTEWPASVVGQFWVDAIASVCFSGWVVDIDRVCRPPTVASEYVAVVRTPGDSATVLDDGVLGVDAIQAFAGRGGDTVIVEVATGTPCAGGG